MKIPRLVQAVLTVALIYGAFRGLFDIVLGQPIPSSVLGMYMFFIVAGVFMVYTFTEESSRQLVAPIRALVEDPSRKGIRNAVFVALPLAAAAIVYQQLAPKLDAPLELRSIHPAPPSEVKIFGRRYDLLKLENPYRKAEKDDPAGFEQLIAEGGEVYVRNCQFCHGDKLDGKGPYAAGLNPAPINFQDVGTIAQLQESYLFWRIATGGPGLPNEAAPWLSAMPVWEEFLTEDEIWKVILFLYERTGHRPRSWSGGGDEQQGSATGRNHSDAGRAVAPVAVASIGGAAAAPDSAARSGDGEDGEAVYLRHCIGCHGQDGDGLGPAAERLNPPPRDFTLGQYKIKTSAFDDPVPNDEDLLRMIGDGMPGTAMPGWADVLSRRQMLGVIAYIKTFAGLEQEQATTQLEYGSEIAASADSIETGRGLFHEDDRCSECHGQEGKGDAVKKLRDDNGARTWPRNLTKPWTFRASNDPRDIFRRISVGIPGTQMPSFADPASTKKLSVEERWHIANYVHALAKTDEVVRPENTVIEAARVADAIPLSPDDPVWRQSEPVTFLLVPQILAGERLFTPSNDTITVRALHDGSRLGMLLEWDDRTKSIPGDPDAEKIADEDMGEDAVAVQMPVSVAQGTERPYFAMGDAARPVTLWRWSSGSAESPASVSLVTARGSQDLTGREAAVVGLEARGEYANGTWRVIMTRPLRTSPADQDLQITQGAYIPIAFATWDGSNGERGARHTLTTWYWLLVQRPAGALPGAAALAAFGLVVLGQAYWLSSVRRRRAADQTA
jgi:DMSO reductase family type II enzyme heme b subunit